MPKRPFSKSGLFSCCFCTIDSGQCRFPAVEGGFMQRAILTLLLWLFMLDVLAETALAGGPFNGARAAGMGTAFVGVADDPAALVYNPAGLTQVKGTQVSAGATAISPSTEFTSPAGGTEKTSSQTFLVPHFYLTEDFGSETMTVGLGVYSLYGVGGTKWSRTGLTRYVSTENLISTFSVNPTIAWRPTHKLSLAAGIDYLHAESISEKMLNQSGAGDGRLRLKGDGNGWGYNLGVLYRVNDELRIGLAYRSGIRVNLSGDVMLENIAPPLQPLFGGSSYSTKARTGVDFPEVYSVGVSLQATEKLLLAVDVELVRWSSFDKIALDFETEIPAAGFTDTTTNLGWGDSWQYMSGVEYRYSDRLKLRTGYVYLSRTVPDASMGPDNPDAVQHGLCVGGGYRFDQATIDLFYDLTLFQKRHVDNGSLPGTYRSSTSYAGVTISKMF